MEPVTRKDILLKVKNDVAPNADTSCKHCGLYGVKIMEAINEEFKCSLDYYHCYCQGRCSKYKEKKKWFGKLFS